MFHAFVEWASNFSLLVATTNTCVVLLYLLFAMTNMITKLTREGDIKTVYKSTAGNPEIVQHIKLGKYDTSIHFRKLYFWKWVGIVYLAAILIAVSPIVLIPALFLYLFYRSIVIFVKIGRRSFQ